ncbi:TPA: glycosyltransferase family 4 protein [Serratia marcescens]|nr:glycosyltransferase family 4 protein [Serratia marcescens]HEJ6926753.1 glycosyltransferase family 4 protein [Serratia marcescens]HEJ7071529.1 glycosyltransferase family 4 protein [Serratia marcescens]HEJ7194723.1 glycosyltransferase family 4 protein [Serratia marcescens]
MIYINARFLTQEITGVQRFAEMISLELCKKYNDIIFVCPQGVLRQDVAQKLRVKQVGFSHGHLWEQVELPAYLMRKGSPLLINLGSTGPIAYKNKIITHHDITYLRYPESYSRSFLLFYKLLVPMMIRTSKHLLTVSEFSKREITNAYQYPQDKTSVIYNAVEDKFQPKQQDTPDVYFLAVASKNFHKNHRGMIDAFLALKEKLPSSRNIKLKIIGDLFKELSYKNHNTGAKMEGIEFLGRVDDNELIRLYQNAYAFIFPSFYEGFGIPPLEAQACGCPVLASNQASIPEILGESALYFNPFSGNEMIHAMEDILRENELRLQLIRKGHENIKRFSWKLSAEKLIQIVRGIG